MLDNISIECQIANNFRNYLTEKSYNIVQLIYPGGQASISINYTNDYGEKKFCYPDVIAFSNNEILIGEIKPRFSGDDYKKLIRLKNSILTNIYNIIERYSKCNIDTLPISYCLIHKQHSPPECQFGIKQYIFHNGTFVIR